MEDIVLKKDEKKRRKDITRGEDLWHNFDSVVEMDKIRAIKDFFEIENTFEILDPSYLEKKELNFFVQFSIIPIKNKEDGTIGVLINTPFFRIPDCILQRFKNKIFIVNKNHSNELIAEYFVKNSDSLVFGENVKPMEAIKEMLLKMEHLKVSDLTISWRRDEVIASYAVSGRNVKKYEDRLKKEFAEKIRISLINMSYENQSEKLIDGKFNLHLLNELKEYRLSVITTVSGYSIVIRSYQNFNENTTLDDLGYMKKPKAMIESILENNPYGLFLITGPTGSGKTTTIYTVISEAFKTKNLKIKTAEDPVEILISGIDQCQINLKGEEKHQVTYENLLASFMRQRPDIVVIGEIRDKSVAKTTIEVALTGHIVISTLHTNNIKATFTRLQTSLGISKDRIEDTISGVLSQQLVDKLCDCKVKSGKFFKRNEVGCKKCEENDIIGYNNQILAVEIAELEKMEDNFLKDNFRDYYSYEDSANDLYNGGFIDKITYEKVKTF